MSAVRAWDRGTHRVPWSAVKLLRLLRSGDLGALRTEWRGWTINRNGLVSPEGYAYSRGDLGWWSLTCRQAEAFRQSQRQRATGRSVTEPPSEPVRSAPLLASPGKPVPVALSLPAGCCASAARRAVRCFGDAGKAVVPGPGAPAPAPGTGLVSFQKQRTREGGKAHKTTACSGGAE